MESSPAVRFDRFETDATGVAVRTYEIMARYGHRIAGLRPDLIRTGLDLYRFWIR